MAELVIKSPYPYFGGKSIIAAEIWRRLGDVQHFVDPFLGSGAILLGRPTPPQLETVNDLNGYVANFWRAVQADPEQTAYYADWPVNENDLHARHAWLVAQKDRLGPQLEGDPDWCDFKIAGWWVWGMSIWIGHGFCSGDGPWRSVDGKLEKSTGADPGVSRQLRHLAHGNQGIQRQIPRLTGNQGITRQVPHLGNAGRGIVRQTPHLADNGRGIIRKMPHLADTGRGVSRPGNDIYTYFEQLAARFRRVRVCSGDWSRVLGSGVVNWNGLTGIALDPPYTHDGREKVYEHDTEDIAAEVRAWAVANGQNPSLRIAYCGFEDDFAWPAGWTPLKWTAKKGYAGQSKESPNENREREIIWFSPGCLNVDGPQQLGLFDEVNNADGQKPVSGGLE